MRSGSEKTKLFFQCLRVPGRPGRSAVRLAGRLAGHTTQFQFFALATAELSSLRGPHTASHTRNAIETEIDFPVGTTPPTSNKKSSE